MRELDEGGETGSEGRWRSFRDHIGSPVDRRSQGRFAVWTLVWGVVFLAATWMLRTGKVDGRAAWVVAVVPTMVAIVPVMAYLRFLRHADELVRRIQLEALAFGFAAGVIFGVGYQLLERAGAPELALGDPVVVMLLAFAAGQVVATTRYR